MTIVYIFEVYNSLYWGGVLEHLWLVIQGEVTCSVHLQVIQCEVISSVPTPDVETYDFSEEQYPLYTD